MSSTETKFDQIYCQNEPTDVISCVQFINCGDSSANLLAASWDASVRLYSSLDGSLISKIKHGESPILDATSMNPAEFRNGNSNSASEYYVCGGLSGEVQLGNFNKNVVVNVLGKHENAIRNVKFEAPVITGSWDKSVKFWDLRSCENHETDTINLKGKVFAIAPSSKSQKLIICDSTKSVFVYDRRNLSTPLTTRDASNPILKTQIRAATCIPDGLGFTLASVEGRVAWEYFEANDNERKNYAFKCHREKNQINGSELIYPVNAIAFHHKYFGFATGGGDGVTIIWDGFSKKRLWRSPNIYSGGITSLSFHANEPILAMGISQGISDSIRSNLSGSIVIRILTENDVTPKQLP